MPLTLSNARLRLHLDLPHENYQRSRFDWSGKITQVFFQGIPLTAVETTAGEPGQFYGQGFYNEFGMDALPGFQEANIGDWCHKIGVGLVRKEGETYLFHQDYDIRPATFEVKAEPERCEISCESELVNGYAYLLHKQIELLESGFAIRYRLQNTGTKPFVTSEYTHNFLSIDSALIGEAYQLRFPFVIRPDRFGETVNPESAVAMGAKEFTFLKTPQNPFFFSHLSGGENVAAQWELLHTARNIGISETTTFHTQKINLWGWSHVISPELFIDIHLKPGEASTWSRTYRVFRRE